MRFDGHGHCAGTDINWSRDLLPSDETLFTLDGEWLFAERHSLGLRYQKSNREATRSLRRQITIGDQTYPVGARLDASTTATTIDSSYTFWWVRHENFGIGPSFGLLYTQ